jgi:hypothetical protein
VAQETTWKVSRQITASGARSATTVRIHGAVAGHELQLLGPVIEGVEEGVDGVFGAALGCPHNLAGDVVARHGEVALTLLVLDLVEGDGDQPIEQVDPAQGLGGDPDTGIVDRRHEIPYRSAAACLLPTMASWTTRSSNARVNAES